MIDQGIIEILLAWDPQMRAQTLDILNPPP